SSWRSAWPPGSNWPEIEFFTDDHIDLEGGKLMATSAGRVFSVNVGTVREFEYGGRVVPENLVHPDSRDEGESEHHATRCLPSSICLERLPTCSSRGAGSKSRTCFFGISSILP